jgi:hypothetical protein
VAGCVDCVRKLRRDFNEDVCSLGQSDCLDSSVESYERGSLSSFSCCVLDSGSLADFCHDFRYYVDLVRYLFFQGS